MQRTRRRIWYTKRFQAMLILKKIKKDTKQQLKKPFGKAIDLKSYSKLKCEKASISAEDLVRRSTLMYDEDDDDDY